MTDDEILERAEEIRARRKLERAREEALRASSFTLAANVGGVQVMFSVAPEQAVPIITAHYDKLIKETDE